MKIKKVLIKPMNTRLYMEANFVAIKKNSLW